MKHLKIYEQSRIDAAISLSEMFFEQCDGFGSEDMILFHGNQQLTFYFLYIGGFV